LKQRGGLSEKMGLAEQMGNICLGGTMSPFLNTCPGLPILPASPTGESA
jgi:hypothetical protein